MAFCADGIILQEISLAHSFNEGQIEWFKAGSALNLVRSIFNSYVTSSPSDLANIDGCQGQAMKTEGVCAMSRRSRLHIQLSLLSFPNIYFLGYLHHSLDSLLIYLCNNTDDKS